jgi:hypothetical protein
MSRAPEHTRPDLYSRVTAQIVEDLQRGVRPWTKPWSAEHLAGRITRPLRHSGQPYSGINVVLLWADAVAKGFSAPIWMTFRQALELGAHVRKGEHGSTVVYANRLKRTETGDDGRDVEREIPFLKAYTVFNVELDGEVIPVLAGGLLPGRAELGLAGEDAEVGALLVVRLRGPELGGLDVEAEGLDGAGVAAVRLLMEGADGGHGKSPVVSGPRPSRPRWRSGAEGRPGPAAAGPKRSVGRRRATCLLREECRRGRQGKEVARGRCRSGGGEAPPPRP